MRIVGISGSIRKDSHNTGLLRAAGELLPPGAELELVGIGDLPLYSEDIDTDPAPEPGRAFPRGGRCSRGRRDQHPRVQRLDPGPAQERD